MTPREKRAINDLFDFLMDVPCYEGTLNDLAKKVGHSRAAVAGARSATRSAEFISENKWEVGFVGVGSRKGRWEIADLSSKENCERSLAVRWPEVAEDCRRLAAVATLRREAAPDDLGAKAEEQTAKAMLALAETFSRGDE